MNDTDDLESEIEGLCLAAERYRTLMRIGCIAALSGATVLALMLASVFRFDPTAFGLAVAALLGGLAFVRSNTIRRAQILESYRAREARHVEVFDGSLRSV